MHADSAAAIGICRRSGTGRVWHRAVRQLWVQEGLRREDFELYKVLDAHNPADILTKAVNREVLDRHLRTLGLTRADGRAETAPRAQLQAGRASGRPLSGAPGDVPEARKIERSAFASEPGPRRNECFSSRRAWTTHDFRRCAVS